jgi:hypothetical protein
MGTVPRPVLLVTGLSSEGLFGIFYEGSVALVQDFSEYSFSLNIVPSELHIFTSFLGTMCR